jgi:5-methylcytosine-specific restriction protein A
VSAAVLRERPVCEECGREGATDVDHVVSLERGGTHDPANLRALCHGCHSRKTVAVDGGFGRTPKGAT